MKRCRTRAGTLGLRHEGRDYLLDVDGADLPDVLAESIRTHVNVIVEDEQPEKKASRKPKDDDESEG